MKTPIQYVTLHFGDWRGAASLRYRNCAEIMDSSCWCLNTKPYPVGISCRHKSNLTFRDATTCLPTKWRLRNEHRNSILITRHYPDLGYVLLIGWRKFQPPIGSTDHTDLGSDSSLVSRKETTLGVLKCRLFSQAVAIRYSVKITETHQRSYEMDRKSEMLLEIC